MKKTSLCMAGILAATCSLHAASPEQAGPPDAGVVYKKHLNEPVDLAHAKNLYVAGYAHLDTQWRWTYVQTIENDIRNTMEQNFPLLEKYPNYIFNFTGSRRYEFMKQYYPEEYERVKQYVAQGRWVPAGSSVDECDVNAPGLESIVRHMLYGNRFFEKEFGKESTDFLLPDCFGFPQSLPEILAHGGLKGFSTQKLTWGSAVGIPFNVGVWIGPDGSSVMAALNPGGYGSQVAEDLSKSPMWLKRINEDGAKSGVYADFKYYGTGDQGGAPKANTVAWIEHAIANGSPIRVVEGSTDQIFRDMSPADRAKLPTYKGELELVNHSAGSLSSEAYMKHWNRKNEQLAQAAEGAATTAAWMGAFPYPYEPLYNAWDLVLGSQMHDIMPGTSVPKAYEFSWNDEVLALNQFASIAEKASAAVLSKMETSAQGVPVAVYNPLAIEREDPVEATIPMSGGTANGITAYDPQGQAVPTQILGADGTSARVLFIAKAPSVGYAVYDLRPGNAAASELKATGNSLENGRYKVTLNEAGDIGSIFDKTLNRELLSAPARLSIHTENPSHYPAWNMDWEDREKPARAFVSGPAEVRIVENGPARVALQVRRMTENSIFTQDIRLAAGGAGDRVEILNHIDWRAQQASLRSDFPFTAKNPEASFDDKVGVTRRGTDNPKAFELAQQQWMDLSDTSGGFGVSILNDSKYGSDKPDDHTLRSTMIYTPGVRGGTPDQATQDIGRHEILLGVTSHKGNWGPETPWEAARLNQPLRSFLTPAHPGPMGKTFSLLSANNSQVQVAAVKQAEDSNEVIVRVKELTGNAASSVAIRFASAITGAREVNAQERQMGPATVNNGALTFDMKGFGLRAFAVKLAPPAAAALAVTSQPVALAYDTDVISSRAKRTDGAMDAAGDAYPAELFPAKLDREGVGFQLGSTADGAKNALTAHGQQIDLPAGNFTRIHLLVAADGDADGKIQIGDEEKTFEVPNWTGYVGQWDNRLWPSDYKTNVLHFTDSKSEATPVGLAPGYIKRTPVAWFATHHNSPDGDAYYNYSYLFEKCYDLPSGAKTVTLPNNPKIRVFALSVSNEAPPTPAAAPLYDTLADHVAGGAPIIPQAGQSFTDSVRITLVPPLYYKPRDLHYTLDGSDPTASSPVYEGPFFGMQTLNIAARQIDENGNAGPVTRGTITIHDTTPPRVESVVSKDNGRSVEIGFSKPLEPTSATDAGHYSMQPAVGLGTVALSLDKQHVTIIPKGPLAQNTMYKLTVSGVKDASPQENLIQPATEMVSAENTVYTLAGAKLPGGAVSRHVDGLPLAPTDNWTMNLFVKTDSAPQHRALIAGFGETEWKTGQATGDRYIAASDTGILFWSQGHALETNSPLETGRWQMITATYNGDILALYKDGEPIGRGAMKFSSIAEPLVEVGPSGASAQKQVFSGSIQDFTIRWGNLTRPEVKKLYETIHKPE